MTRSPPTWFSSMVAIEVLFQLPFFVLALYAMLQQSKKRSDNPLIKGDGIFRSLCLIYGSSTATTLVPIFSTILVDQDTNVGEKGVLLSFYLPYFIFPVWLVVIAVCEENIFASKRD